MRFPSESYGWSSSGEMADGTSDQRAIVIGAGFGDLVAASLASNGVRVTPFDEREDVGGGGMQFGLHAFEFDADGRRVDYPGTREAMRRAVERGNPADADGYERLVDDTVRVFRRFHPSTDRPFHRLSAMLRIVPDVLRMGLYRGAGDPDRRPPRGGRPPRRRQRAPRRHLDGRLAHHNITIGPDHRRQPRTISGGRRLPEQLTLWRRRCGRCGARRA